MSGTLFVVATPIGNLEDLTFRALRVLREVALIAAEDTRRTAKLLAHYEIRKSMVSLREHNEARESPRLVARMMAGESVALVSDAGTPGIADPGAALVAAARQAGLRVVPIPGPSAVAAALSVSGFPGSGFAFFGFPPSSGREREDWIDRLTRESGIAVFFESPHRVKRTLDELGQLLGDRPICINRELTKINEMSGVSPIRLAAEDIREQGEFVFVLAPQPDVDTVEPDAAEIERMFGCLTESCNFTPAEATRLVSLRYGLGPNRIKRLLTRAGIARKRSLDGPS
jgi:16S rRNA (cytidine1402-2'-O)-methyltransferase